jgi:hypothetical protein
VVPVPRGGEVIGDLRLVEPLVVAVGVPQSLPGGGVDGTSDADDPVMSSVSSKTSRAVSGNAVRAAMPASAASRSA